MSVQFRRALRKNISKQVKGKACKFRFTVAFEYLDLKCNNKWKPSTVSIVWFRGARSKTSAKPTATTFCVDHKTSTSTFNMTWVPAASVELVVTLYKDPLGTTFRSKDYMFVIENVVDTQRKKLAIFPCNMADYASIDGQAFDLEMEFKSISKKVASAKLGTKIKCEFVKEGEAYEDDMQSNFSHVSDLEYHQRMSELVECSDEEEEGEATVTMTDISKISKRAKHTWSRFIEDMKTIEYKNAPTMMENPLAGAINANDDESSAPVVLEPAPVVKEERQDAHLQTAVTRLQMRERDARKKVVSAVLEELNECDEEEAAEDELSDVSSKSPYSSHKPTKLQFTFPDKKVPSSTYSLDSRNDRLNEWLNDTAQESNSANQHRIEELENENKSLKLTNVKLERQVMDLSKDKAELNVEINELQLLVEDLKMQLKAMESLKEEKEKREAGSVEGKPYKQEKEYCQVRGWLCKRGVKGPTGRRWRRRWFSTDSNGRLYYYKQTNNKMPRGFISLDKIVLVQDLPDAQQDVNNALFNVATPARTYELMAHDAEEKLRWINALDYLRHVVARKPSQ